MTLPSSTNLDVLSTDHHEPKDKLNTETTSLTMTSLAIELPDVDDSPNDAPVGMFTFLIVNQPNLTEMQSFLVNLEGQLMVMVTLFLFANFLID